MDTAALQEVVTVLKEEVEHHKRQARRMQRENRLLVRTILQLRQQQKLLHSRQPEQQPCVGKTGNDNEKEHGGSHERDDLSEFTHSQPSSATSRMSHQLCSRCSAEHFFSTTSPRPRAPASAAEQGRCGEVVEALGNVSPLPLEGHNPHENDNKALQVRVRALENQLQCERMRRKAQADEFSAELELMRFALDEAERHPSRRQRRSTHDGGVFRQEAPAPSHTSEGGGGGGGDVGTSESTVEYHEVLCGSHLQQELFDGLVVHSRGSTPTSMGHAEKVVAVERSDVPPSAASPATGDFVCTGDSLYHGSPRPKCATQRSSTIGLQCVSGSSCRECMTPLNEGRLFSPTPQSETSRDALTATNHTDTPWCENFLSRAALRMEGRRQRLRNAVMLRTTVDANGEASVKHRDAVLGSSNRQVQVHLMTELPPHTEMPASPSSPLASLARRGQWHLPHRRTASLSAFHGDDAAASPCRYTASSPNAGIGSPIMNPNQLGVEVDPKGPHNRTWYAHQVLRMAFAKFVYASASSSAADATAAIASNSFEKAPEGADMELFHEHNHHHRQQQQQEEEEEGGTHSDTHYVSSDMSYSFDSEEVREQNSMEVVGAQDTADCPLPLPLLPHGLYRNIPSSAVRRAIDETTRLHFRCCQNRPLLETVAEPFPPVLPPFHAENSDSELVASFAVDVLSPSNYREDEICLTLHSPVLFSQIRSFLGMDAEGFRASLGENAVWRQAISPGKSGTTLIFFGNFVMKSLKKSEFKFLRDRFLSSYVSFCERHPDTLLPRFYALLTFSWLRFRTHKQYVLMQNVFSTRYYIHRIYDVKGSTVGRSTTTETAPRTSFGALLLKDNDLPAQLIICGPLQRAHVLAQLRSDVNFLHSLNIVDYSCLIGVRSRVFSRKEGPSKTIVLKERCGSYWQQTRTSEAIGVGAEQLQKMDNSCIHGCDGGVLSLPIYAAGDDTTAREDVYYLGIIDVLQEYTPAKRLENFAKGLWSDRRQISVVPPKEYAERLYQVLENVTV
ncbi:putative phosphatidylinositol-4-phosphate 5-kinase-like [Trypanosoma rangeli]|uniref:Putative phosphatidylinositol-4-phosphate 5-kinase-like n=1 Tax=Trypanosoma rangeli TaxID=5698 RepID=A0A422N9L4_TRYRA|nr:putative phosphatidylinositol-4-phosphate 5-kinase-like [Trypanosoma rangeli]RNF02122.1 putative phosphatidylinositol-4-phosphate 5-kinase-like [Trypanosoma rangeli]|eukprot:RNF02122.1 putative phosphatidylinositol-4-phosphate 5-kinase-like [Trypanosoma rangeli]